MSWVLGLGTCLAVPSQQVLGAVQGSHHELHMTTRFSFYVKVS